MTPSRSHSCRLSSTLSPSSTAWGSTAPVSAATHLAASTATPVSRRCGSGTRFLARTSVLVKSLFSAPGNNCDAMVCGSARAGVVAGRAIACGAAWGGDVGGDALALRSASLNA